MKLKFAAAFSIGAAVLALSACGGGGGGNSTPAPAVTMSFSSPKIAVGQTSTLTWTATNATSCTASGAWSGVQPSSGSIVETPTAGGPESFTLSCSGAGGQTAQAATLIVPMPVLASSYQNKIAAATAIGPQPPTPQYGDAIAYGDFFQDGTESMVVNTLVYNVNDPSTATDYGSIYFYKKVNGVWVDHTSDILSNTVGCLHPRKAIVADFNGDGKPDVFFACHGFDAAPFSGEQPHMLLSQPDGTYKNVMLPFTGYFHGASAADFNGNGYDDILVADPNVVGTPYFLVNNKDGTFSQNFTRLPLVVPETPAGATQTTNCASCSSPQIYSVELIDIKGIGKYDALLGGTAPNNMYGNWVPTIFYNSGTNTYSQSNVAQLPYNSQYGALLDFLFVNGNIYTTNVHLTSTGAYGFSDIERISGSTNTQLWAGSSNFPNGSSWLNWIIPYQGNIDSLNSSYGVSVPQ